MSERTGVSDRCHKTSPWPVFVALGVALSELGIFVGIFPIAVGGVLLLAGSVAGILTEAGYVTHLWKTAGMLGVVLLGLGAVLALLQGQYSTSVALAAIEDPNAVGHRLLSRGLAIAAAGIMLVAVGGVGEFENRAGQRN